jgi:hypothetical protein
VTDIANAVQELVDRAAIRDVMTRYARGLDRRDFDLVASCFAKDATASFSGEKLAPGVEAIIEYVQAIRSVPTTMHFMGDMLIDFDGETAQVETYATVFVVESKAADGVQLRGLRYTDRLIRQGGGWVIADRVHCVDWTGAAAPYPASWPDSRAVEQGS